MTAADEIREWTAANERARAEYAAHPIVSCVGVKRVGGEEIPCMGMAGKSGLCRRCVRERDMAVKRMRNLRLVDVSSKPREDR